jgi:hypothetical protein
MQTVNSLEPITAHFVAFYVSKPGTVALSQVATGHQLVGTAVKTECGS